MAHYNLEHSKRKVLGESDMKKVSDWKHVVHTNKILEGKTCEEEEERAREVNLVLA